jgi:hypothetical protein
MIQTPMNEELHIFLHQTNMLHVTGLGVNSSVALWLYGSLEGNVYLTERNKNYLSTRAEN